MTLLDAVSMQQGKFGDSMRFTITLPDAVARSLDEDVEQTDMSRSTLIAHYIAEHYERESSPDHGEQIFRLKQQHEDEMTYTTQDYERQLKALQVEVQKLRSDSEGRYEQQAANYEKQIAELNDELQSLKIRLFNTEKSNKDIITGMQHGNELLQSQMQAMQRELQLERDHNLELRNDKEQLQKQLELVTLRLPAPKEGFWSRVFGRKKKEQEG